MVVDFNKIDKDILNKVGINSQIMPNGVWSESPLSIAIMNYCLATNQREKNRSFKIIELLLQNGANPNEKLARALFDNKGLDYINYYLLSVRLIEFNCPNRIFNLLFKYNLKADYKIDGFATNNKSLREALKSCSRENILALTNQ